MQLASPAIGGLPHALRPSRTRAANPSQLQPRHRPCRSARTAAQLASRERGQKRLNQKHLARKMWASVRIASRLLAWWSRAGALRPIHGLHGLCRNMRGVALDEFVELTSKPAPCKCTERERLQR